jgi:predicted amidohydrolase
VRIHAASVQFCHRSGDKDYNLATVARFVEDAAARGVQLVVFPEMCIPGYWHVVGMDRAGIEALAERVPDGPSVATLLELSRRHSVVVGAGLLEAEGGSFYNSYVVAEPDGSWHVHRKIHAFESEHITPGDSYTVFASTLGCTLGVLTCYDNNIVENARMTALLGADILLAPHQTGGVASRSPYAMGTIDPALWEARETDPEAIEAEFRDDKGRGWLMRWLPSRAHDNGMFLVFSNGVGPDNGEVRTGNAMLIDCYGRIVAETWRAGDDMVSGELDLSLLARCTGRRWLRGRRPELYGPLAESSGKELHPIEARFSSEPT